MLRRVAACVAPFLFLVSCAIMYRCTSHSSHRWLGMDNHAQTNDADVYHCNTGEPSSSTGIAHGQRTTKMSSYSYKAPQPIDSTAKQTAPRLTCGSTHTYTLAPTAATSQAAVTRQVGQAHEGRQPCTHRMISRVQTQTVRPRGSKWSVQSRGQRNIPPRSTRVHSQIRRGCFSCALGLLSTLHMRPAPWQLEPAASCCMCAWPHRLTGCHMHPAVCPCPA